MSASEPLCQLIGINQRDFARKELLFLEAELFASICAELKKIFREQYSNFFQLVKFTGVMEDAMLDNNFVSLIVNDILVTQEYTTQGIAEYTNTHEDVINEVITGINCNPSATFLRKIIDLHKAVRKELYDAIIKKIVSNYVAVA